ncbi:MAG: Holliday junction branch migration protein RuvA [Clostridia bacterium]|nr:Holliday junction branch migration protein RuvA [Clostridia bacterium]
MFYSLTGELVHTDLSSVAVSCNGIAFECRVSMNTLQKLGPTGSQVTLYTYLSVRQDGVDLFGFYDPAELNMFKLLTSVSSVGPKIAMGVLSELDPARLSLCVAAGDYKAITRAPGVGPKMAQRIVLELKDKLAKNIAGTEGAETFAAATAASAGNTNMAEAVSALVMLGYSQTEASVAAGKADPNLNTEEIIKIALKNLM